MAWDVAEIHLDFVMDGHDLDTIVASLEYPDISDLVNCPIRLVSLAENGSLHLRHHPLLLVKDDLLNLTSIHEDNSKNDHQN